MDRATLLAKLSAYERYSDSRINAIRGCQRRGLYEGIGPRGEPLQAGVGDGADAGGVMHHAFADYYRNFHSMELKPRRLHALYELANYYPKRFDEKRPIGNGKDGTIDKKHARDNLIVIADAYFERFKKEDEIYSYVAPEIIIIMLFKPEPEDMIQGWEPFWYITRSDGLLEYTPDKSLQVKETKTIGSGIPAEKLEMLRFSNQTVGYTYVMKRYVQSRGDNPDRVTKFVADVVLVSATMIDFSRDTFTVENWRLRSWRNQLIFKVIEWRRFKALMKLLDREVDAATGELIKERDPNYFDYAPQDTEDCNKYGKCAFYNLCLHGPMSPSLNDFKTRKQSGSGLFDDLRDDEIEEVVVLE